MLLVEEELGQFTPDPVEPSSPAYEPELVELDPPEVRAATAPIASGPTMTAAQKSLESFEELIAVRCGVRSGGAESGTSEKYCWPSLATSVFELLAAWA